MPPMLFIKKKNCVLSKFIYLFMFYGHNKELVCAVLFPDLMIEMITTKCGLHLLL